jgi:hypothetical protein
MDGSRVEEMILAGQIDEVARYCESDVLNNFRVWLMYELFRGSINTAELGWSERQVGDYVTTRKATPSLTYCGRHFKKHWDVISSVRRGLSQIEIGLETLRPEALNFRIML